MAENVPKKLVTVLTPCFNEEANVNAVYEQVRAAFAELPQYEYEHLFIDNCSRDRTVPILKKLASEDRHVKLIVNSRNFGHVRSPFHGLMQARGDMVIEVFADLQDPPSLIPAFLKKWEEGYKIVIGVKTTSDEKQPMRFVRDIYYGVMTRLSDVELIRNFCGFGLYDRQVIEVMRTVDDPYPYFRGLVCEVGFERAEIEYRQTVRKAGKTKNNFYTLFDIAMLGLTSHSKIPLRLATMMGFVVAVLSMATGFAYGVYKLLFWNTFTVGMAPMVIGLFFFSAVQIAFLGIVGEYVGAVHTKVSKRPLVVEKERVGFDDPR